MAHITCDFFSESLGFATSMEVILPEVSASLIGMKTNSAAPLPPVLYLLHGMSDDQTIWMRRTSIERYAAERGIAVVMPAVQRSCYRDMNPSMKYWSFMTRDLPAAVGSLFRVSQKREDTFAAGLSMGGYGALKLALNCPEKFAAAASLSGAFEPEDWLRAGNPDLFRQVFGTAENIRGSEDDLPFRAHELAKSGIPAPKLFFACGKDDGFLAVNRKYRDLLRGEGFDLEYYEGPGNHNWQFWDEWIQKVLAWLPVRKG